MVIFHDFPIRFLYVYQAISTGAVWGPFRGHRTSHGGRPGAAESGDADLGRSIRLARSLAALAGKPKAALAREAMAG